MAIFGGAFLVVNVGLNLGSNIDHPNEPSMNPLLDPSNIGAGLPSFIYIWLEIALASAWAGLWLAGRTVHILAW